LRSRSECFIKATGGKSAGASACLKAAKKKGSYYSERIKEEHIIGYFNGELEAALAWNTISPSNTEALWAKLGRDNQIKVMHALQGKR
jgi:hypothetical protein